jgi:hypothetical protein
MVVCACVSASVSDRGSSLPIEKASKRQCDQSDIFRARAIPSLNGMPSHNPERARERFRVSFRYRRSAIVATVCLWVDGEISALRDALPLTALQHFGRTAAARRF